MGRLLTFNNTDEKDRIRFDSLWVIFKGGDIPDAKSAKVSIRLEDYLIGKSKEGGGLIKLAQCPTCNQRFATHETRSLPKNPGYTDLIIEKEEFQYLRDCFDRWKTITAEIKRHFVSWQAELEDLKDQSHEEIQAWIKKRDEVPALPNGNAAEHAQAG